MVRRNAQIDVVNGGDGVAVALGQRYEFEGVGRCIDADIHAGSHAITVPWRAQSET